MKLGGKEVGLHGSQEKGKSKEKEIMVGIRY